MESYVKQLLQDADLTVVTKKHVRMKYKEHVGRELLPDEKSKIHDMVYAFVKELSAQQKSPETDAPITTPDAKEESPGNKENKQSNQKPNTFIIKGQVVDRNDLYKSKSREKKKTSPDEKHKDDEVRKKNEAGGKNRPDKMAYTREHASAAKLRINEVMSAVLGSDKGESSSEVSSVSSLTDTSLSEVEEAPEAEERINEALQKLKAARDKKIQMSIEKKKVNKEKKGNKTNKVRRSLAMGDPKSKDQNASEDSEAISIISISSVTSETAQETVTESESNRNKKLKKVKHLFKTDSDSGEIKLKRTPKRYDKKKDLTAEVFENMSENKKKLVKRKRKKVENESESDSDSEDDNLSLKHSEVKYKKKSRNCKKEIVTIDDDSDSENETLDKIAAKTTLENLSTKSAFEKDKEVTNKKKGETVTENSSKKSDKDCDSESSTGNTPLAKKKSKRTGEDSDSEHSTGDTPLVRKKWKIHSVVETDSESETCVRLLANKKTEKAKGKINKKEIDKKEVKTKKCKNSVKEKDLGVGRDYSKKSSDTEEELSENRPVSESSSGGHTPLAQIKKNNTIICESMDTDSDSDASTGDTPLIQKKKQKLTRSHDLKTDSKQNQKEDKPEKSLEKSVGVVKQENDVLKTSTVKQTFQEEKLASGAALSAKIKRKLSESSNDSTRVTSAIKKGKRLKLESASSKENDSELSDESTGDTPLVRKKYNFRNNRTNVHLDTSVTEKGKQSKPKQPSEKVLVISDSDTGESEELANDTHEGTINCDTTTDNDSPLKKVKGHCKTSEKLESSSEEESQVKKPTGNKRSMKKKLTADSQVNGTSSPSEHTTDEMSEDSETDSDDLPLAQFSKQSVKTKVSDLSSDSEDDIPLSKTKAAQSKETDKKANSKKEPIGPASDAAYVRLLRQICRECQMFVRNDRELAGCSTDKEKIEKMEQMLRNVGMKGKPSLKKAEEVKLMKEAKELSADNIISSETGRVMRKVKSIWARRTISPVKPGKRKGGDPFVGLKDIVDSEGTESG